MQIKLHDTDESLEVVNGIFNKEQNDLSNDLIHQIVISYMAKARAGTVQNKSKADVQCSGKKPWKQKGTGRARVGTAASPLWRGGGVTFAARPRDYSKKINKKMYKIGMANILSKVMADNRIFIMSKINMDSHKTKDMRNYLKEINKIDNTLFVVKELSKNLYLASRNIHDIKVVTVNKLNPVILLKYKNIVIEKNALSLIEGWLK